MTIEDMSSDRRFMDATELSRPEKSTSLSDSLWDEMKSVGRLLSDKVSSSSPSMRVWEIASETAGKIKDRLMENIDPSALAPLDWGERARRAERSAEKAQEVWGRITRDSAPEEPRVRERVDLNPEVQAERRHLARLAVSQIRDRVALRQLQGDMAKFERRAWEANPPVSSKEVANTYREVARLLESRAQGPTYSAERAELAINIIHQAALPHSVDQGQHKTCTVGTMETRLYARNPSAVARVVADMATTGSFVTAGGVRVALAESQLIPDQEARSHRDSQRSYASQIFQLTAVNVKYAVENARGGLGGKVRYEQVEPLKGANPPDTGERVVDYSTNPPRLLHRGPNIGVKELPEMTYHITGKRQKDMVVMHSDSAGWFAGTRKVASVQDLSNELSAARHEGRFPLILRVHTKNEPFFSDSGAGKAGGSGAWHVVTVTDYDEATGRVSVDNQWGSKKDHFGWNAIPVHQLYAAMKKPEQRRSMPLA